MSSTISISLVGSKCLETDDSLTYDRRNRVNRQPVSDLAGVGLLGGWMMPRLRC